MCNCKQQKGITNRRKAVFTLSAALFILTLTACVPTEKRIALVIGNQEYQNADELKIAVNDAEKIAQALKISGFDVKSEYNLTNKELGTVITRFNTLAKNADAAVFYYAGHGIQFKGVNYLLPIDARISKPEDIDDQAIKLGNVLFMTREGKKKRVNIKMLDACRNNGFIKENRGLAEVLPLEETLVAFATSPGKVAKDNGFYAQAFLETVKNFDGLRVQRVFDIVRQKVGEQTSSKQIPLYYTNISKDFFFVKKKHARLIFTY